MSLKVKTRMDVQKTLRRIRKSRGLYKSLQHAAASLRTIAQRLLRPKKGASSAGSPPHSRTKRLKHAILYSVDRDGQSAVIGPALSKIGRVGGVHEHGGFYKGTKYDARPFMGPALEKAKPKLPKHWAGSVR